MKTYNIADIIVLISYHYQGYLDQNLEKYEVITNLTPKYKIESIITSHIEEPKEQPIKMKNPYIIRGEETSYFYIKNKDGQIKAMFTYDHHFYHTKIYLNQDLLEDPSEIEYVFMSMIFMEIASREGFISLHASAIKYKEDAILISAPSQTGKSTHASYWLDAFNETSIINDDKPLIKKQENTLYCFGSPFSGKGKRNENIKAKLKSIVFLKRGLDNQIITPNSDEVLVELVKNIHRPMEDDLWNLSLSVLEDVIQHVSFYQIYATHSVKSAETLRNHIYIKE